MDYAIEYANKASSASRAKVKPTATVVVDKSALIDIKHDGSRGQLSAITGHVIIDINGKAVEVINERLVEMYKNTETKLTEGCLDVTGGKLTIKDATAKGVFYNYNGTKIKKAGAMTIDNSCCFLECETIEASGTAKLNVKGYIVGAYFKADEDNLNPLIQANECSEVSISGLIENGKRSTLSLNGMAKGFVDGYLYFGSTGGASSDTVVVSDDSSNFVLGKNGVIESYFAKAYSSEGYSKGRISGLAYSVYSSSNISDKASVSVDEGGLILSYYGKAFELGGNSVLTVKSGAMVESVASSAVSFTADSNATLNNWGQIAGLSLSKKANISASQVTQLEEQTVGETENEESLSPKMAMQLHEAALRIENSATAMTKAGIRTFEDPTSVAIEGTKIREIIQNDVYITVGKAACSELAIETFLQKKIEEATAVFPAEEATEGTPEPENTTATVLSCMPVINATYVGDGKCTINIGSANPYMILNKTGIITLDKKNKASFAASPQGYVYSDSGVGIAAFGKNCTVNVYEGLIVAKAGIVAKNGTLNIDSSDKKKEIVILGKGDGKAFNVLNMTENYNTGDGIILDYNVNEGEKASNLKARLSGNSSNLFVGLNLKTPVENAKAVAVYDKSGANHKVISAGTYQTDVKTYAENGLKVERTNNTKFSAIFNSEPLFTVNFSGNNISVNKGIHYIFNRIISVYFKAGYINSLT